MEFKMLQTHIYLCQHIFLDLNTHNEMQCHQNPQKHDNNLYISSFVSCNTDIKTVFSRLRHSISIAHTHNSLHMSI